MSEAQLSLVPARPVWVGRLSDLLPTLTVELQDKPLSTWTCRLLRGGALIALQRDADNRRTLRIAREVRPLNERARRRWEVELGTFLKFFDPPHWLRQPDPQAKGIAALYVEVFPGEIRPGHSGCPNCGAELHMDAVGGEANRCGACDWLRPHTEESI